MNEFRITDTVHPLPADVELGDKVHLTNQEQEVVACQETGVKMLNIDADQLQPFSGSGRRRHLLPGRRTAGVGAHSARS